MICAISTKTTGLKEFHEVIEFNIKPLNGVEVTYKIRPERLEAYEEKVQEINGISRQVCESFPSKEEAKKSIFNSFKDITPIGHMVDFDFKMLRQTFGDKFIRDLFGVNKVTNTLLLVEQYNMSELMAGRLKPFKSAALKAVCEKLGIKYSTKCEAIQKLYFKMKELHSGN